MKQTSLNVPAEFFAVFMRRCALVLMLAAALAAAGAGAPGANAPASAPATIELDNHIEMLTLPSPWTSGEVTSASGIVNGPITYQWKPMGRETNFEIALEVRQPTAEPQRQARNSNHPAPPPPLVARIDLLAELKAVREKLAKETVTIQPTIASRLPCAAIHYQVREKEGVVDHYQYYRVLNDRVLAATSTCPSDDPKVCDAVSKLAANWIATAWNAQLSTPAAKALTFDLPPDFELSAPASGAGPGAAGAKGGPVNGQSIEHAAQVAEAQQSLKELSAALEAKDDARAFSVLAGIPSAVRADAAIAADVAADCKLLLGYGDQLNVEAQELIDHKEYGKAMEKLRQVAEALPDSPPGKNAQKTLGAMMADPSIKAAVTKQAAELRWKEALESAQALAAKDDVGDAYMAYLAIGRDYPGTPAAAAASREITKYEADPKKMAEVEKKLLTDPEQSRAIAALQLARDFADAGKPELARKRYLKVISDYPQSVAARIAAREMARLAPPAPASTPAAPSAQ